MTVFLEKFANKIINLNKKVENIKSKKPEIIVLILYFILHIIISIFHEPWFDEAVAWQIAKVANIKDILFEIPHYEGHPPLWHLVLLPFAKLGAPYEVSLSFVSLIFSGLTMYLILFKSPFPRIIKLLLPFNYFMFYQYGVISRPYCMMMLAFVLLAILYEKHNEKPFLYVLGLAFLCLTSAYGIVIAGGIAIAWIIEMILEKGFMNFFKTFFKDRRLYTLTLLLVFAIGIIWIIIPAADTYATSVANNIIIRNNVCFRLLYTLIMIFSDFTICNVYSAGALKSLSVNVVDAFGASVLGVIILFLILYFVKQKKRLILFIIPYILYGIFSAVIYSYNHHIGILFLFVIFSAWIALDSEDNSLRISSWNNDDKKILNDFFVFLGVIFFIFPILWNFATCLGDVANSYSRGRNEANFIIDNKLVQYNILSDWRITYDEEYESIQYMNTELCDTVSCVLPYFNSNIAYNFMNGDDLNCYVQHKILTEDDNMENIKKWKENGYPDVILGNVRLDLIFDKDELSYDDYALVYLGKHKMIWKIPSMSNYVIPIFVRKDLIIEMDLQEIDKANLPFSWHLIYNDI